MGIPKEFPSDTRLKKFGVQMAKTRLKITGEVPDSSRGCHSLQVHRPLAANLGTFLLLCPNGRRYTLGQGRVEDTHRRAWDPPLED